MIPVPDIGHVYPKTGLDVDLRMDLTPTYASSGSLYLPGGSSDDVEVDGLSWTSDGAWSFTCWVKSNDLTSAANKKFFSVHASGNSHRIDFHASTDANLQIYTDVSSSQPTHTFTGAATEIQDGTWHHLALVAATSSSNSVFRLFIDGHQFGADSSALARADISLADSGYIGNIYTGSGAALTGSLAHVGFWNAALSEAQVRSLMTATTYAEAVTKGGSTPVAYYLFEANAETSVGSDDGTLGGSAVIVGDRVRLPNGLDLSGNRRDARSASGRSIAFDGSADHLENSHPISTTASTAQTMICWVKATDWTAGNIISNATTSSNNALFIYSQNNNLGIHCRTASTTTKVGCSYVPQVGVWHHVAATFDTSDAANPVSVLYVNGKDASGTGLALATGGNDGLLEIGGSGAAQNIYFEGSIADVKLFDVVLTAAQVLELYQNPELAVPTGVATGDLIHHFPLFDYDIAGSDGLNGLYAQNLAQPNKPLLCTGGTMEFNQPTIPQLGLRSSSSRVLVNNASGKQASATLQSAPGTTFTVACWFMEMANDDTNVLWRMGGTTSTDDDFLEAYINSSGVLTVFGDGTVTAGSPSIGEWHHLVVVSDGSSPYCKVYLDNSEVSTSGALGQAVDISTATLIIGDQAPTLTAFPFDGIISEVAVWDSALSSGNVSTLWNSGVQGVDANTVDGGNLLNWYKCDNPTRLVNLSDNSTHLATYAADDQSMATVPEGTTADLSVFGTLTSKRPHGGISGVPGIYGTPGRNYAELASPIDWGTGNWTISMWVQCPGRVGEQTALLWDYLTKGVIIRAYHSSSDYKIVFYAKDGTTGTNLTYSNAISDDRWLFICWRRAGTASWKMTVKDVDGNSYLSTTDTTSVPNTITSDSEYNLRLNGGHTSDGDPYHRGANANITNLRIWVGDAITDEEVDALWVSGARTVRGT